MSGTAQMHVEETDATGVQVATCDIATPFNAKSSPGRVYAGASSQNGPVVITLPATRHKVGHFRIGWQSECESTAEFQVADDQLNFPIGANRRFGDEYNAQPYTTDAGGKGVDHYDIHGKVSPTRISGRFHVTTKETNAEGAPSDSCNTRRLTYTAKSG